MAHVYKFSNEEKFDMLNTYLQSFRNADTASARYLELYPERRQPHKTYFRKIVMNLLNYGAFEQTREQYDLNNRERVLSITEAVTRNPSTSVRSVSRELNIPKSTVHNILKKEKFHPYKPTIVQGLKREDFARRMRFCNWYIQKCEEEPHFPELIIWTDETRFTNCGVFNKHNTHHWSTENHHLTAQRKFQTRYGFNVWCGILGNNLIGPFYFVNNLNGARYTELLRDQIIPAIRGLVPNDDDFRKLWFQQDGCPAHNSREVSALLAEHFGQNIICNSGPIMWPARSPDLTPLDFYLWGFAKNEVYEFEPPHNINELQERVRDILNSINRRTLSRVVRKVLINCRMCRDANGQHFQHLREGI